MTGYRKYRQYEDESDRWEAEQRRQLGEEESRTAGYAKRGYLIFKRLSTLVEEEE